MESYKQEREKGPEVSILKFFREMGVIGDGDTDDLWEGGFGRRNLIGVG